MHFIRADVSSFLSLAAFFAAVQRTAGHIVLVFANAGVIQPTSIWDDELSPDGDLLEPSLLTLDVTLKGVIFTAKLAVSCFKRNPTPGGALVFTASSSSYNERPMLPLYSISKHGVSGKGDALCVCPLVSQSPCTLSFASMATLCMPTASTPVQKSTTRPEYEV